MADATSSDSPDAGTIVPAPTREVLELTVETMALLMMALQTMALQTMAPDDGATDDGAMTMALQTMALLTMASDDGTTDEGETGGSTGNRHDRHYRYNR